MFIKLGYKMKKVAVNDFVLRQVKGSGKTYSDHLSFDEKWKKYSPGRQLLRHNLEIAWNEGRTIDFLPLAFDYKEKLATVKEEVHELHWFKRSIRGWVACRLIRWNMKVRKKMKERKKYIPNPDNPVSKALRGEAI